MNAQPVSSHLLTDGAQLPVPCSPARAPLRVGIVGARRQVQGIGEHVARHLAALGAKTPAIVGTHPDTVAATCGQLRQRYGLETRGYLDLQAMLDNEPLDAVAICSPDAFHREHLRTALEHGLHVLCEKPLVFERGRDSVSDARPLVDGFAAAGKVLMVNEQWPYTLPYFETLHPEARLFARPPQDISMLLCPATAGLEMIPNSIPHALSILLALCPSGGRPERIRVEPGEVTDGVVTAMTVSLRYVHAQGETALSIDLCQVLAQPRPACYRIDGRSVHRLIEPPDYAMYFVTADLRHSAGKLRASPDARPARRLRIEDPLKLLLADFLRQVEMAQAPGPQVAAFTDRRLLDRLRLLRAIDEAAQAELGPRIQ